MSNFKIIRILWITGQYVYRLNKGENKSITPYVRSISQPLMISKQLCMTLNDLNDLIFFSYLSYQDLLPTYPLHIDTSTLLLFYYAYQLSCQSFVELYWLFPKKYFLVHMYALFPMSFLEIVKHPWITVQKLSLYTLHGNHRGKTSIL